MTHMENHVYVRWSSLFVFVNVLGRRKFVDVTDDLNPKPNRFPFSVMRGVRSRYFSTGPCHGLTLPLLSRCPPLSQVVTAVHPLVRILVGAVPQEVVPGLQDHGGAWSRLRVQNCDNSKSFTERKHAFWPLRLSSAHMRSALTHFSVEGYWPVLIWNTLNNKSTFTWRKNNVLGA